MKRKGDRERGMGGRERMGKGKGTGAKDKRGGEQENEAEKGNWTDGKERWEKKRGAG
jgi:hypothetical protein